jgi:hypothetical protein
VALPAARPAPMLAPLPLPVRAPAFSRCVRLVR